MTSHISKLKLFAITTASFFAGVFLLNSCKDVVITPQPIKPLYSTLARFSSMPLFQQDSVIKADSAYLDVMMRFLGMDFVGSDTTSTQPQPVDHSSQRAHQPAAKPDTLPTLHQVVGQWSESATVKLFTPAVDSVFPTLDPYEEMLGLILDNLKSEGFNIPDRHYAAVVWGNKRPCVVTDSIVFISLNHFLGKDFPGYSPWPEYMRRNKTPDQLPYTLTETMLNSDYPYIRTEESTALSRMMYEGAIIYTLVKTIPGATLAKAMGYSEDQLDWLYKHYKELWDKIITKDYLYSTSHQVAERLVGPAPSTSIISPEFPGRAGTYLGYRLILEYISNNTKVSLPTLLSPKFYNDPTNLVIAH